MSEPVYRLTSLAARAFVAALVASSITVSSAQHAAASTLRNNCSQEQQIFVEDISGSGTSDPSHGTMANMFVRVRELDSACMNASATWSMVNISNNSNAQAEVGFKEIASNGGMEFFVFGCWQTLSGETCTPLAYRANADHWMAFRISNSSTDASLFSAAYDYLDGGGWHTFGSGNMPFTTGISQGETSRIGDNTGMLDHHQSLQYKVSNNNWAGWSHQNLDYQNVDNGDYYWFWMSHTEYEVCGKGGTCPWQ